MSRQRTQLAVLPKSEVVPLRLVRPLTPKQEAFARAYVETGNASEAYRRSYDVSPDAKPEGIAVDAAQLLANPNITLRVSEIEAECLAATQLTVGRIASEGFKILELANARGDTRAAIAALATLEKLHARLAPEVPKNSWERERLTPASEWLAGLLGNGEAIDRPPRENREQWIARVEREGGGKVSDAELIAVAADGKDPHAWLEEQAKAATPEGRLETRKRVEELLERAARQQASDAEVETEFPILQQVGATPDQ